MRYYNSFVHLQSLPAMYRQHLFFCTNQRDNGKACCQDFDAQGMRDYAKALCKSKNMDDVRVNQAGCLGQCSRGPVLVVYPDNVWYQYVDEADIEEIIVQHIENHSVVTRLQIHSDKPI